MELEELGPDGELLRPTDATAGDFAVVRVTPTRSQTIESGLSEEIARLQAEHYRATAADGPCGSGYAVYDIERQSNERQD